jgi:hypothetical protein
MSPYSSIIVDMSTILIASALLLGIWFYLMLGKSPGQSMRKFLVTFVGCLALYLTYEACSSLQDLFRQRDDLDKIWDGQTGQNAWGVGQIGAPFAWAPLLLDMVCAVCTSTWATFRNLWRPMNHGNGSRDVERGTGELNEASNGLGGLSKRNVNDVKLIVGSTILEQGPKKTKGQEPWIDVDEQNVTDGRLTIESAQT